MHRNGPPAAARRERGAAFVWLLLLVGAIIAGGIWIWHSRSTAPSTDVTLTYSARQERLRISVVEAGQLKAAKSADIYCEVRGSATILELVDEGKQVTSG